MLRSATLNLRIPPAMRERLDRLSEATNRPRSYIVEAALSAYLDVNEWQVAAVQEAVAEADSPGASWTDHADVAAEWRKKLAD